MQQAIGSRSVPGWVLSVLKHRRIAGDGVELCTRCTEQVLCEPFHSAEGPQARRASRGAGPVRAGLFESRQEEDRNERLLREERNTDYRLTGAESARVDGFVTRAW